MQCSAVCCNVLQCVLSKNLRSVLHGLQSVECCSVYCRKSFIVFCSMLQGLALCSVLQCVAVCCSVLQCVLSKYLRSVLQCVAECRVLQCVAVCCSLCCRKISIQCCSMLHCVALCSVLQCGAVYSIVRVQYFPKFSCYTRA